MIIGSSCNIPVKNIQIKEAARHVMVFSVGCIILLCVYISILSDRRHVIDSLPLVWMLDGVLVTAAERQQVSRFFKNSEVLERPVRHKLKNIKSCRFIPSHLKELNQQAIPGK